MCNLITEADQQWRKGYFAGQGVEMRWHGPANSGLSLFETFAALRFSQ
jgi:hypothetical protein